MKVCWFGTYERDYPRNRIAIDGLKRHDVEVVECHEEVWGLTQIKLRDYFQIPSLARLVLKYLWALVKLTAGHSRIGHYDVMVVGFNGHLDVFLARLLSWMRRSPLVLDPLVSVYNTLIDDKQFFAPRSLPARLIDRLETLIYRLPDLIVADTEAHRRYFHVRFGIPEERLVKVLTGADSRVFVPSARPQAPGRFRVLYYGKYLPLHGVRTIFEASKLLENDGIEFTFIGKGQFLAEAKDVYGARLTREVPHVTLIEWVPYEELPKFIEAADVCLGLFGGTLKADLVMPNKAYQAFAMGKPLITGRSRAAEEVLGFDPPAVFVPMRDVEALAGAIRALKADPQLRARLGARARERFLSQMSLDRIGGAWREVLYDLVVAHGGPRAPEARMLPLVPEMPIRVQRAFGQAREAQS